MYEAKAQYYQKKEERSTAQLDGDEYSLAKTGRPEIDAVLGVLSECYNGICRVDLAADKAECLLIPAHFGYDEKEAPFSTLYSRYVGDAVDPDHRRAMLSFFNYENIKHQLQEGITPKISYKKAGGKPVNLSVYKIGTSDTDTLWVFAKA